jgi:hypothetical protein
MTRILIVDDESQLLHPYRSTRAPAATRSVSVTTAPAGDPDTPPSPPTHYPSLAKPTSPPATSTTQPDEQSPITDSYFGAGDIDPSGGPCRQVFLWLS